MFDFSFPIISQKAITPEQIWHFKRTGKINRKSTHHPFMNLKMNVGLLKKSNPLPLKFVEI
jgi:hypothetical protein